VAAPDSELLSVHKPVWVGALVSVAVAVRLKLWVGVMVPVRVCVQVRKRVRVGVYVSWTEGLMETDWVKEPQGLDEPEIDTVLVFDCVVLDVNVDVLFVLPETMTVRDPVVLALCVLVAAAVAVPNDVWLDVLDVEIDAVPVPVPVEVLVDDAEPVSVADPVVVAEEETERGGVRVGGGRRLREPVPLSVTEARRVIEPLAVAVAVWVARPVIEPEAEPVTVTESFRELVSVVDCCGLRVPRTLREGVVEAVEVLDRVELRVPVSDLFSERDLGGDEVPVLEAAIVRVAVPDAVVVRVPGPLRVPVTDAVDVLDWETELVPVAVKRIDRLRGGDREGDGELDAVFEPRAE